MRFRFSLLLFVFLITTFPAVAHASLIESAPVANARLEMPPTTIRLSFTEPVEPNLSRIILLDLSGAEVARGGETDPDDARIFTLNLPDTLHDDVYTVSWRVVSATDGHATQGTYPFGVGMSAGTRVVIAIDESARPEAAIGRIFDMLGTALTLGVILFAVMVWRPGAAQGLPSRDGRFITLMRGGWVFLGAGLLFGLLAQAANIGGGSVGDALADGSIANLLSGSIYGQIWLVRMAIWLVFGALLTRSGYQPARWGAMCGLAIGLAILPSLVSHARAADNIPGLVNDMLHRIMAALWVGGLVGWVGAIWPDLSLTAKPVGRAVTRFSNIARFYVMMLAAGGLFAATQQIPDIDALTFTAYGRAMTVKGLLFGLMFVLAAFNLLVVERRLKKGHDALISTLRITVSAEMMLGALIMLMSAVMASTMPSKDVIALRAQAAELAAKPEADPYFGMEIQDDVMMHIEVYPGLAGTNEFTVSPYALDEGHPIDNATRVRMRISHREQNLGESVLELVHIGEGVYSAEGANLSIPGEWRIRVTLQRPDAFDTVLDFDLTIPQP